MKAEALLRETQRHEALYRAGRPAITDEAFDEFVDRYTAAPVAETDLDLAHAVATLAAFCAERGTRLVRVTIVGIQRPIVVMASTGPVDVEFVLAPKTR